MQIAFIGLGNMGGPMAINLHKAGHSVKAFDLSQDALAKVKAEGLQVAASAQDAVQGAEAIVTMLPASQHVEGLFLGNGNLLASIAKGTLVIDSSTIAAATSQKVAKAAEALGIDFIDAPVSGARAAPSPAPSPSWWAAPTRNCSAHAPCWKKWAPTSSTPAPWARARRPRSATTCCWAS